MSSLGSENLGRPKVQPKAPAPGEIIAGKYEVLELIGAGGMGVVVAARHLSLNRRVAVKLLHADTSLEGNAAARFLREARAAASLRSEHVAHVMDVDKLETGAPFMVMEYLAGSSLSKVIRDRAPLAVEEAVDYVLQACEAIAEAHALGIVHRDLKPGNLFLTQRPDGSPLVKVLDFGISKIVADDEQDLTATNMVLGSPQYASPEQLRSLKSTDSRTDIWALGVILYYMLAGRRPFEAETLSALFIAISNDAPLPLSSHRPDIPPDLETIVMRCLEKNRNARVQSVELLAQALRPFGPDRGRAPAMSAPGLGVAAPLPVPAAQPGPLMLAPSPQRLVLGAPSSDDVATSGTRGTWATQKDPPPRGAPMWLVQVGVAIVALGVLMAAIVHFRTRDAGQHALAQVEGAEAPSVLPPPVPPPPRPDEPLPAGPDEGVVDPPPVGGRSPTAAPSKGSKFIVPGAGGAAQFGTTRAKIQVMIRAGGGGTVGARAPGELVVINQEQGDWFRISHAGTGKMIMGWTPKKTIRLQ